MFKSISEPSLNTLATTTTGASSRAGSRVKVHEKKNVERFRGAIFWEGKFKPITLAFVNLPWSLVWQTLIVLSVSCSYVIQMLVIFFWYEELPHYVFVVIITISDIMFLVDVIVLILHRYWKLIHINVKVCRKPAIFLLTDIISLIPMPLSVYGLTKNKMLIFFIKIFPILRTTRIYSYIAHLNNRMHSTRKYFYLLEHAFVTCLYVHGCTCICFWMNKDALPAKSWYDQGLGSTTDSDQLSLNSYGRCWYYCMCRTFNVIFGDSYPVAEQEIWLAAIMEMTGFVLLKYYFIGVLAWDYVVENTRRNQFVDKYHHLIRYLNFHGAPKALIDQARCYNRQLWEMKDGILFSKHLHDLPLPLRMELIYDINIAHFQNSILFRDTGEAFLRHVSLLMRHEIFLAEQTIWNQDVVKNGMLCIKRGVIELLSDEDDESPMIAFKEGTVLGELSLFYSIPAKVTVKAATYVELQVCVAHVDSVLKRTDFLKSMIEHTSVLNGLRKTMTKRLREALDREIDIANYDKEDSRMIRQRYRPIKILKNYLNGVEEEDAKFVDDSHMYYKDYYGDRQPKFITKYLELYQLTNQVTTIEKPKICIRPTFPWILEPNTSFTQVFDSIHFCVVIYVCIATPYLAILFPSEPTLLSSIFNTLVTSFLLINIYLQLTTAISDKGELKDTVQQITAVKMSTVGFYLDLLSMFPVYVFTEIKQPGPPTVIDQIAFLLPILQVWHIVEYINKRQESFYSSPKLLCLCKYGLLLMILSYWSGCLVYLTACPAKVCKPGAIWRWSDPEDPTGHIYNAGTWMYRLINIETRELEVSFPRHERPVMTALSFGTDIFTGTGSSVVFPGKNELFQMQLIFMMGMYLSFIYIANMCSIYVLNTNRRLKFKDAMKELFFFLSVNHVSSKIKARVKKFFGVQWYYNSGVSTKELFVDMSNNIQQEVLSIEMIDTLLYCPLFQECSRDFLQTVASNTRSIVLPDTEIVQHCADIGRDMYIIQKGHCRLLDNESKSVTTVGPGFSFGVIEMLFGLPKVYTVVTVTNCIFLHIEYTALVQCLSSFPDVSYPIFTTMKVGEIIEKTVEFEEIKVIAGKNEAKANRIAQEIKESFVVLTGPYEKAHFIKTFEKLGIMRYLRYIIFPVTITPHGIFLKIWCTLRFFTAIYYTTVIPYNIATSQHMYSSDGDYADVFLYVDVIVMSYVAYYDHRSLLITHPLYTIHHYLRHSFVLDLITVFPIERLLQILNDQTDLDLYRINRMLMITRISGAFNYWESNIMSVSQVVILLKFLPIAGIIVNFATAFVFSNSCYAFKRGDEFFLYVNCTKPTIIQEQSYEIDSALVRYVTTFYWALEYFAGLGCSPLILNSGADEWYTIFIEIIGFLYFAFMFGYVASTRSSAAYALLQHRERRNDLGNFLYQEKVDPILIAKTLKYFEYVWKRTNGSNPQEICRKLNSALMEDTLVFMYERTLREVPLFGNVERSFIRVITQHLKEMYFLKGETVIQCRDVQKFIYIIYRGKVDVLSSYNEMITCMGPGGMFGNFTGMPISCSEVTIFASRNLDLLVISSETFFNLIKFYPKIQEPLSRAFEMSNNYILPITMEEVPSESLDEEDEFTESNQTSDSVSASSRYEFSVQNMSTRSSQSNVSQAKSQASVATFASYSVYNFYRPGSLMYQILGYFTCAMVTLTLVTTSYTVVTLNNCQVFFWFHGLCDIFFHYKWYLSIHQGYTDRNGDIVMDARRCKKRYYRHKLVMWTDLLANFPLELFGFCFKGQEVKMMHILRCNRLLRVKYLAEFYQKTSTDLTNNLTTLQTVITILVLILILHTLNCTWLLALAKETPIKIYRSMKAAPIFLKPRSYPFHYVDAFYGIVAEVTATGADELVRENVVSLTLLAFCLVGGKVLAALIVATSMQISHFTKHALTKYEKKTMELIDVLKNQGLSNFQLKNFWNYVQQLWVTERGRQLPVLLHQTPYVRRCNLMSAMFGHHLRNCFLFKETGESFLRQLTVLLDYTIFYPGNYIVVSGDSEARMYWVSNGTVAVVSVRTDLTETTHELLGPGDMFGIMQGLYRGVHHCFSYRAETKVSILALSLDAWINIMPFFPDAEKIIQLRAKDLFTNNILASV